MKRCLTLILLVVAVSALSTPVGYHTKEIYDAITTANTNIATNVANIATNTTAVKERVQIGHYQLNITATVAAGTVDTGLDIPVGSIIKKSYLYPSTTIVSANDNTIAFHCESANDLYTATDLTDTATGAVIAGALADSATESAYIYSDGCNVTLTVGAGASGLTAGVLDFIVEYVDL